MDATCEFILKRHLLGFSGTNEQIMSNNSCFLFQNDVVCRFISAKGTIFQTSMTMVSDRSFHFEMTLFMYARDHDRT